MTGRATTFTAPDLAAALQRAALGDRAAFMQVYDATCDAVYKVALWRTGDPAVAADLTANAYVSAWERAADHCRSGLSPTAWLTSLMATSATVTRRSA